MIFNASQHMIEELFGDNKRVKYFIPKYQRAYQWKKEQWKVFFDDILENDFGYFLGSIICINKGVDSLKIHPLEIIDGQQRLTTISLLYAAIYYTLNKMNRKDEGFISEKKKIKNRLIEKHSLNEIKIELSHQEENLDTYKTILYELKLINRMDFEKPLNLSHKRLYKAYNYFKNRLNELYYDKLINFIDKLNSAVIVKIEVKTHSDAFTLFESVNNRGIPLSAMDLVKNKIFAEIETKNIKDIDTAFEEWKQLVKNIEDYSIQIRFLRQYYNSFQYKPEIKIRGIPRATKSNLIKIYEKLIENDPAFIFNDLILKSKIYHYFINPKNKELEEFLQKGLMDLLNIGGAPSYTLLLYLFSEYEHNTRMLNSVIDFLVKYFVRRNLTDFPSTRKLDQIFINLINYCEENREQLNSELIVDFLTNPEIFSTIEEFEKRLRGDIYKINAPVTRFILTKIEERHATKETLVDFWKRGKNNNYVWTIEHILPKSKNLREGWVQMIAGGNQNKAKELQELYVHKLGNLTLTGYNPNLSNFDFIKKRDRTDKNNNFIGYKNKLFLNNDLRNKNEWTLEDIKKRTDFLVREALSLFSLEKEIKN
ncbi:MAG: DUF262 domain-containing protein [Promethearchaeota archaeon]